MSIAALAISSAKLKEFHPPEAYTDDDDSDNEEESRVPKSRDARRQHQLHELSEGPPSFLAGNSK